MRKLLTSAFLLMASFSPAGAAPAELGWMTGCWAEAKGEDWAEECWTVPRGGMLMGSGRTGTGANVKGYEFMRIAPGLNGEPVFWGSPAGAAPVPFKLVRSSESEAVFENPAHDYPVTIRYWRDGEILNATTTGAEGKNPMTWRYKRM